MEDIDIKMEDGNRAEDGNDHVMEDNDQMREENDRKTEDNDRMAEAIERMTEVTDRKTEDNDRTAEAFDRKTEDNDRTAEAFDRKTEDNDQKAEDNDRKTEDIDRMREDNNRKPDENPRHRQERDHQSEDRSRRREDNDRRTDDKTRERRGDRDRRDSSRRDRDRRDSGRRRSRTRSRDRRRESSRDRGNRRRSRSKDKPRSSGKVTIRRKPSKNWDVAPAGFENCTPLQYKDMQESGHLSTSVIAASGPGALQGSAYSRQSRRLFVGNIPFCCAQDEMLNFFNEQMVINGLSQNEGNPILACHINHEKNFAFLEFRSIEETTSALRNLDRAIFMAQELRLRRPQEYVPLPGSDEPTPSGGLPGQDSPNNLYIGGLPQEWNEGQVRELLESFGRLKHLHLIMDMNTGFSRCYAFAEYEDAEVTDMAIQGLNNMTMSNKYLVVRRAREGNRHADPEALHKTPVVLQVPGLNQNIQWSFGKPTEVICFLNMVQTEELGDDEEYEDIMDDIKGECNNHGFVRSMEIPRPIDGVEVPGCGKVFVEFETIEHCMKAMKALEGKKFAGRIIVSSYFDPDKYHRREFS